MSGFFARYAVVAVAGALGVWYGVPELKPVLEARRADRPALQPSPAVPALSWRLAVATSPAASGASSGNTSATSRTSHQTTRNPPPEPAAQTPPLAPSNAGEAAVPAPAPQPIGPVFDWGILVETTNVYNAAGTPTGKLPGGTVVERVSVHESSRGSMVRCRVLHNQLWREGIFVPELALAMFQGSYVNASPRDRDRIVRYFTLRSMVADRRDELRESSIRANPHFTAYQAAAKALTEFQAKAKELVAQRDAATGMERSRLEDTLRRLKSDESAILHSFRKAEEPYKRWRASNDDGSVAIASDAQINAWENELAALEPDVRGMVRGL